MPIIIIDKDLKIPKNSNILKDISYKRVIIFTAKKNKKSEFLAKVGCEIIQCKLNRTNKFNLKKIFYIIYSLKISDILVEAGGIFFTELIKNNLVDELHLFKSKKLIGENGKPAIWGKEIKDLHIMINEKKIFKDDIYYYYSLI